MATPLRIVGFVAGLLAVFGLAMAAGSAVGPAGAGEVVGEHDEDSGGHADGGHDDPPAGQLAQADLPGGLMTSDGDYTLTLAHPTAEPGQDQMLEFTISDATGQSLTSYQQEHTKELHLIAVRRDLSGFQHVHPVLDTDGTWTTQVDLTPGVWRVYADFTPGGKDQGVTLGTDLTVTGALQPTPLPRPSTTTTVDGYEVSLAGELRAGESTLLTLKVSRDGRPVTDLQPYLGAYGHLVVLRSGDLAYLHVHPEGEPGDGTTKSGPGVGFYATAPSSGRYRMYLDFKHDGVVRTAELTVEVGEVSDDHGHADD